MNFKTTIALIVLLAVAAVALYFTQSRAPENKPAESTETAGEGVKFVDVAASDVEKLTVTQDGGDTLTLERADGKWILTSPVKASADSFAVDSLVEAVVGLRSNNTVDATTDMGIASPSYTIEVKPKEGTATKIAVGRKSAVGDRLYVAIDGETKKAQVVAGSLTDQLEKPVSNYREKQLVKLSTPEVKQVELSRPDGKLVLQKTGNDWQMVSPKAMPADTASVTDLITAATGARAEEFVSEAPADAAKYQLEPAQISVMLSTAAPATQPATTATSAPTTQAATLKLGGYADIMKKNIYAMTSDSPSIVTLPASTLGKFTINAVTLRDRKVIDIDPQQVSSVTIERDLAATTQPTSRPASQSTTKLERRNEAAALGPQLTKPATTPSTTSPTTSEATSQPSTAPAASKWQLTSTTQPTDASDTRVDAILSSLHPLRATKYLESAPTTQPSGTYTLTVTTIAAGGAAPQSQVIKLIDRGTAEPLIGETEGLVFEADRSLITKLEGNFEKGAAPPTPPAPQIPEGAPAGIPGLE